MMSPYEIQYMRIDNEGATRPSTFSPKERFYLGILYVTNASAAILLMTDNTILESHKRETDEEMRLQKQLYEPVPYDNIDKKTETP